MSRPPHGPRAPRLAGAVIGAAIAATVVFVAFASSRAMAAPGEPFELPTVPTIAPVDPVAEPDDADPTDGLTFDLEAVGLPMPSIDTLGAPPVGVGTGGGVGQVGTRDASDTATIGLSVPEAENASNVVVIILLLTVLSVAPSVLVMMTSFTRIVIVLSLTRNALGIPTLPPQQVIVGLSLFLTLFVMGPTLSELNDVALQPLLDGKVSVTEAAHAAEDPMRGFLLDYTREPELELFLDATETETPIARDEVPLTALIPAFVLSELKSAFILGFIVFVPFLVIDLVVSAVLTSLGMMMLPPTFVSLPLKLLLFVLLDGWSLVVGTLLRSYQ